MTLIGDVLQPKKALAQKLNKVSKPNQKECWGDGAGRTALKPQKCGYVRRKEQTGVDLRFILEETSAKKNHTSGHFRRHVSYSSAVVLFFFSCCYFHYTVHGKSSSEINRTGPVLRRTRIISTMLFR